MPTLSKPDVLIVGAGVSGLTTGICLAEAGFRVRLRTADPPQETTSAVAGASWGPYESDDNRVLGWSLCTRTQLEPLANSPEETGVRLVYGMDASAEPMALPEWARHDQTFRPEPHPPGEYASAWWYTNPLVDMPAYLGYLERRLGAAGAGIEIDTVRSLNDLEGVANAVINCTGLGARKLIDDPTLTPTRGQLLVAKNPGVDWFFQDFVEEGALTYFLPHGQRVVLGGSAQAGSEDLEVDPATADGIIERCARIEPLLRDVVVLEHRVGLRPARPRVRLERDETVGFTLIHNYGHAGSGMTLSWGCAEAVRDLMLAE